MKSSIIYIYKVFNNFGNRFEEILGIINVENQSLDLMG